MPGSGLSGALGGAIGELAVLIVPDTSGFAAKTEAALAAQTTGGSAAGHNIGQKIGVGMVAGVAGAFGKGVIDFTAFERGMNEIFTLIPGQSQAMYDELSDQTKSFSADFGVSTDQAIGGLYDALGAGIPQDNVFDFLETANEFAKAGAVDLTVSVDALTTAVNAFGLEGAETSHASDALFTAVKLGKVTVDELAGSLYQVAPIAAAMGVSIDDVAAGYAVLTAAGTPAAQASTQLKSAIAELGKSGTKAAKNFEELTGKTFNDFIAGGGNLVEAAGLMAEGADATGQSMIDLFGSIEGGQAFLGLSADMETSRSFLDQITNSAGSTEAAFDQMEKGIGPALDKIKARLSVAFINLGETLGPTVETIGLALAGIVGALAELPGPVSAGIIGFVGLLGAGLALAGPMLKLAQVITGVGKAVSAVTTLLAANPYILIIAATIAVAIIVYKNWDKIKAAFLDGWEAISRVTGNIVDSLTGFKDKIVGIFESVRSFIQGFWRNLFGDDPDVTSDGAFGLGEQIGLKLRDGFVAAIAPLMDYIVEPIQKAYGAVVGAVSKIADGIEAGWDAVKAVFNGVLGFFQRWGKLMLAVLLGPIGFVVDVIITYWDEILAGTKVAFGAIVGFLGGAFDQMMAIVTNATETIVSIVQSAWSVMTAVISTGWSIVTAVTSTAWDVVTSVISTAWNTITTVISTAMAVISTAISTAWTVITTVISTAVTIVQAAVQPIVDLFQVVIPVALSILQAAVQTVWDGIVVIISTAVSTISGVLQAIWDKIDGLENVFLLLKSTAQTVWDGLRSIIGGAVDFLIGKINALKAAAADALGPLGKIGDIAGKGIGTVGNILGFDSGGVVPGPMGEPQLILAHGGETVLPTHKYPMADLGPSATPTAASPVIPQVIERHVHFHQDGAVTVRSDDDLLQLRRDFYEQERNEAFARGEVGVG